MPLISPTEWYWVLAPIAAGVLGVVLLLRGFVHVAHARSGRATAHLAVGTPLTVAGFALALVALNTQTFARLSHENDVANVAVKAVDPARGLYHLPIQRLDVPDTIQGCDVQGEWVSPRSSFVPAPLARTERTIVGVLRESGGRIRRKTLRERAAAAGVKLPTIRHFIRTSPLVIARSNELHLVGYAAVPVPFEPTASRLQGGAGATVSVAPAE